MKVTSALDELELRAAIRLAEARIERQLVIVDHFARAGDTRFLKRTRTVLAALDIQISAMKLALAAARQQA